MQIFFSYFPLDVAMSDTTFNFQLSLNSESCHEKPLPRNTAPNPFNLKTEVCVQLTTSLRSKTTCHQSFTDRSFKTTLWNPGTRR